MTVKAGTYVAVGTHGLLETLDVSVPTAPTTPTITAANPGTGITATVTVVTGDAVTQRLYYRKTSSTTWTAGLTRTGTGTITQTGLTAARYEFQVISDNGGVYSLPSNPAFVNVAATTITPTGSLGLALYYLRESIAASATFQAWTSTADATEAKTRVYKHDPSTFTDPCAVVDYEKILSSRDSGDVNYHYVYTGNFTILFRGVWDTTDAQDDAFTEFDNNWSAVMSEVQDLSGTAGYLALAGWEIALGPYHVRQPEAATASPVFEVVIRVRIAGEL